MGDREEALKSMITNIIDDKNEEAAVDFHRYVKSKMTAAVNREEPKSAAGSSVEGEED